MRVKIIVKITNANFSCHYDLYFKCQIAITTMIVNSFFCYNSLEKKVKWIVKDNHTPPVSNKPD